MPRKSKATAPVNVEAVILHPAAIYTYTSASRALGLRHSCLARDVARGRLKGHKIGNKVFFTGKDLLAWIKSSKPARGRARAAAEDSDDAPEGEAHGFRSQGLAAETGQGLAAETGDGGQPRRAHP
jgi:hypothetical protein